MYLLDTNTLIYYFKGMGNVSQNILSKSPQNISVPAIVLYELEVGIAKSDSPKKRIKQLHEIMSLINIIPFGEKEAKVAANIRATLEKRGTPIGPYDILIAGTALTHQAILVSCNTTEFERVNKLQIENWY